MKFVAKNIITILSLMVTIIVSITAYAYKSDQNAERHDRMVQDSILNMMLKLEITERKAADTELQTDINNKMNEHTLKHIDEEAQRIEREKLKRDYFDAKFTGLEKLILSTN